MGTSMGRVIVVGGLMGLVVVVVVVALVVTGVIPGSDSGRRPIEGPVLVALVLPDEKGASTVRVLDVYTPGPGGMTVRSVDPSQSAQAAGTTASTLAEVYSYGGGDALATAFAKETTASTPPTWVIIGPKQWRELAGTDPLSLQLPAPMSVYDGARLYSYRAGVVEVPPQEVDKVLDGAAYLDAAQNLIVREQVGDAVARRLVRADAASLRSDAAAEQLTAWLATIGTPARQPAR